MLTLNKRATARIIRESWAQYPNFFADGLTVFHTVACRAADEFELSDKARTEFLLSCVPDNQKAHGIAFGEVLS